MFKYLVKNFGLKDRRMAAFIYYKIVLRLSKKLGKKPHTLIPIEREIIKGKDRLARLHEGKFREIAKYLA